MRLIVITCSVLLGTVGFGQNASVVVFSEMGEKFTLYLNSERMNEMPKSNVKLTGLTSEFYQARVDFEDASLTDCMTSNFALQFNNEVTYVVKKNKKGEYVIRFHSQTEGSTAETGNASDANEARRFADVDNQPSTPAPVQPTQSNGQGSNSTTTTTTRTTTTNSGGNSQGNSESVNIGMNINGLNMGINMTVPADDIMENSSSTTVTQQTTTTTSHSSSSTSNTISNGGNQAVYTSNTASGCMSPMAGSQFSSAKESVNSKSFEDSKMTVAKQITKANCLSCNQIKEMMSLFSFEESKLSYAKFAYDYCYNKADYYTINDAFSFESSIDELNKYIESK